MPPEILDIPQTFAPEIIERIIEVEDKVRETRVAESKRILEDAKEFLEKRFGNIIDVVSSVGNSSREILKTAETLETNLIAALVVDTLIAETVVFGRTSQPQFFLMVSYSNSNLARVSLA